MNLRELSDLLGLSQTTVSRALNGYPEVNDETRGRVIKAAQDNGYTPNTVAQRLATGRARAIGHVLPLSAHEAFSPLFADFISGAGEVYSTTGYNMLINVSAQGNEANSFRELARSGAVDGFIVHGPQMEDPRADILTELGLPYLVHGRMDRTTGYSWLDFNNKRAFDELTQYLIDLGHRRIALLNGAPDMSFANRREAGFCAALVRANLAADPALVFGAEMTEPFGYQIARQLLALETPPTAILTSSLISAIGVSRAIAEAGLVMGRDISVATHDDAMSFLPNGHEEPAFTSTRSSIRDAGRRCAEMLIDLIEGRVTGDRSELWEAELIIGTSTGPTPH